MSEISTTTLLHSRMCYFVKWITPDENTRTEIKARADRIRRCIKGKAEEDGLVIKSTPYAGSFPARTGLIRHVFKKDDNKIEIEGQDVDLPFVIEPKTEDGDKIDELLDRFYRYTDKCYPDTKKERSKSSIKLLFDDKTSFDIVPMLATKVDDRQIIIRQSGDRIETSVQKHLSFIRGRNKSSNEIDGVVKFNDCVRLFKWWRYVQSSDSYWLGNDDMPSSFLITLLCAKAYDEKSVQETYAHTLAEWFGYLANVASNRRPVYFSDFNSAPVLDNSIKWNVIDPVNSSNSILRKWDDTKINELTKWLSESRDHFARIVKYDEIGEDAKSLDYLVKLFGNAFKNHCE